MKKWAPFVYLALFSMLFLGQSQAGYDKRNLTVDETSGAVKVRLSEKWRSPAVGMEMEMPTVASTGANGNIKISQQASVISVAANTTVEILEGSIPGLPMQRIVQDRGSAFYDIAPRGDNKLRVEAAYLVAVVKGTQFNVSADADSTTIALFEGHLQVEAPSVGDRVDIFAGQIAKFHRGDLRISILDMNSGELITRSDSASGSGSGESGDSSGSSGSDDNGNSLVDSGGGTDVAVGVTVAGTDDTNATVGITTGAGPVGVAVDATASFELQKVQASLASSVDLANVSVASNLATDIDLGSGAVSIDTGTSIDLGATGLDVGVNAGVDLIGGESALGVDVGTVDVDTGLDLGVVDAVGTVGVDAGLDLGVVDTTGTVDVDAGLDLVLVDDVGTVDVDAGLDLGVADTTGTVDVDAGLDLGLVDDVGATLADDIGDLFDDLDTDPDGASDVIDTVIPNPDVVPDLGDLLGL